MEIPRVAARRKTLRDSVLCTIGKSLHLPSLSGWSLALVVSGDPGYALGQVAAQQLVAGLP